MRSSFPVRIVKAEFKVLYVLVALAVAFGINTGLTAVGLPRIIGVPIAVALSLCIYLDVARLFRGPNEFGSPRDPGEG